MTRNLLTCLARNQITKCFKDDFRKLGKFSARSGVKSGLSSPFKSYYAFPSSIVKNEDEAIGAIIEPAVQNHILE